MFSRADWSRDSPYTTGVLRKSTHLNLDAVDSVDTVKEEDEDENEGDLDTRQSCRGNFE